MDNIILEMRNITKTFPGVKALDNVSFKVREGEIHALVGENGAGKSTLMKVLSGVYPAGTYEGEIVYRRRAAPASRPFPTANISASSSSTRNWRSCRCCRSPKTSSSATRSPQRASSTGRRPSPAPRNCSTRSASRNRPTTLITDIGVGKQQLVEIAKALSKKVRLLILDEPTASLNETDSDALLKLLMEFRKQGMTSIIISHKLNEIRKVADQITILRDGGTVETLDCP